MDSDSRAGDSPATDGGAVVVPAIDAPSSVACLRSLGRRGVRTIVAAETPTAPAAHSAFCDETVPVPSPGDDLVAYKDALLALAMREDVEAVIPVREADVYVLSKYRDEFAEHVKTPWPTIDTLARVQDRRELFDAAERARVAAPDTRLLGDDADPAREWIVKPRFSILTDEYVDVEPERCIAPPTTTYLPPGVEPDVDSLRAEMGHEPLLQEYVRTPHEYGFFALYDEGEPVATFQHRQRRGYSYAGGPSAFRESVSIPDLEESGLALLDELEWHGLAMVEFLRDEETGEFKLMEINPRFWSSLPFTVQTGADFPHYYWAMANGGCDGLPNGYEVGIGGHLIRGELLYLHSILFDDVELVERPGFPGALKDVVGSVVAHPRFDYLQANDVRPFVRDLRNAVDAFRVR
ncbi:carboxylate--amine ligase [Halovivax sp.]|uniref:carboxylate--amine ligase n=1 Tax=Halovivax sp. TaxID=1935978 RepID=UPI0025C70265|nr:carboxylate--amine ligase [Halovivax sp.]